MLRNKLILAAGVFLSATATAQVSVFTTQKPSNLKDSDGARVNYELGMKFKASVSGKITAIRFYKSASEKGSHTGRLFNSAGQQIGSVAFAKESASGWQVQALSSPVSISANAIYTVSVNTGNSYYVDTVGGLASTVSNGKLQSAGSGSFGPVGRFPTSVWNNSNYFRDVVFVAASSSSPAPSPSPSPAPAPAPSPAPAPAPSPAPAPAPSPAPAPAPAPAPSPAPSPAPPPSLSAFPDATNTGIPAGTVLSAYTGPCKITAANTVIDAKQINCTLTIATTGVKISRSKINGSLVTADGISTTGTRSVIISDSEIDAGNDLNAGALDAVNFEAYRMNIHGGHRGVWCMTCVLQDSYIHTSTVPVDGAAHESAVRMEQNGQIIHNTMVCDAPNYGADGGCSADLTGYGDFSTVQYNTVQNNFFKATTGGTCAYGGSSGLSTGAKPYPHANHVVFQGNVFERGAGPSDKGKFGLCGWYFPITDFDTSGAGNSWSGNKWDDGGTLNPDSTMFNPPK